MVFKRRDEKRETVRNREGIMSGKINGHGNINKKITALCKSFFPDRLWKRAGRRSAERDGKHRKFGRYGQVCGRDSGAA